MNKLFLLLLILFNTGIFYAQDCNDLFISEIIFGKQKSDANLLQNQTYFDNYSIEIYNPSDELIELSSYKIELITEDDIKTVISLSGTANAKEPFVISFSNSSTDIINVSDILNNSLDFSDKAILQLTKNDELIDVVGKSLFGLPSDQIDIDALLNDPSYLNDLNIDFRSFEDLTIRRRVGVRKGRTEFVKEEILQDWELYPHFFTEHLNTHINSCSAGTIEVRWKDNTGNGVAVAAEAEEGLLTWSSLGGQFIKGIVEISGSTSEYVTMLAVAAGSPPPGFPTAEEGIDFNVPDPSFNPDNEFEIPTFSSSDIQVELCEVYDDNEVEPTEVITFTLEANYGGQYVYIGFPEVIYVSILNDDSQNTSNFNIKLQKEVNLYPTVSNDLITLTSDISDLNFESIYSFSTDGKHKNQIRLNSSTQSSIDVSNYPIGYHVLIVQTSKGELIKRFIKY
jgi:hypothetical protein